jgi:uncharacterized small protein (DUF1192 family)
MAGKRGNPNFVKKTENVEENKVVLETKSLSELEILKAEIERLKAELEEKSNDVYLIPDDATIELRSNVGKFILAENKGRTNVFIPFADFGSTARVRYDDLKVLYGAYPYFFRKGKLAITRIYCKDSRITINDLYKELGLESIYLDNNKVNPVDIEIYFTDKVSQTEFERLIKNSSEMGEIILETSHYLYRRAKFTDAIKMAYLKQVFRNPNLFK